MRLRLRRLICSVTGLVSRCFGQLTLSVPFLPRIEAADEEEEELDSSWEAGIHGLAYAVSTGHPGQDLAVLSETHPEHALGIQTHTY